MAKCKFKNNGDEVEVENGTPLAEVARENGWPIAFGCENGVCGTCVIQATENSDNLSKENDIEKQTLEMMCMNDQGYRLACQCKVNGNVTIEGM